MIYVIRGKYFKFKKEKRTFTRTIRRHINEEINKKARIRRLRKEGKEFWSIPIAIKSPNDALDYCYADETFGLSEGFIPTESRTYTANYKKMTRSFDIYISESTFIKENGIVSYSDDILENVGEELWLSSTFDKKLSLPITTVTIGDKAYTTNKYVLVVENTSQKLYSINNGISSLDNKYGWNYDTINVNMYGNNKTSILYTSSSSINYGTLIS